MTLDLSRTAIAERLADSERLTRIAPTAFDAAEQALTPGGLRGAAVLVPIVWHHARPSVLLTLRAAGLSAHAGQVAFPGGRIEAGETAEAAALREAAEEVGLDPRLPQVAGHLPEHLTGTGFRVTPVVAFLDPPLTLTPDPGEVAAIFELPLAIVLDPAAPERRRRELHGRMREFWVWPHPEHLIWGATAAMLVTLARVLRE
ncbi:CoA pyrophosphatase [Falsiroseomonas sp.]|uniref:CoA pyrophosphatase n=1 Tax=Falsiroseomonas sp. TaxID=2870721 RepID=UPI003562F7A9